MGNDMKEVVRMNFTNALREEAKWTTTENGAICKNTTGSALLDLFATIGSLRERSEFDIQRLFGLAYDENSLYAVKTLFYARDIRKGLGERRTFRVILPYLAKKNQEAVIKNLKYIGEYGRFDDYYCLIGTPVEKEMWATVKEQLMKDLSDMEAGKPVSLLAKWLKSADASSERTRKLGIYTARSLGLSVYVYKRLVKSLRKYIDIVEKRMSANEWNTINYSSVPSKAMMNYRNAFMRHDEERFSQYLNDVSVGKEKINTGTLYPYDIVHKILYGHEDNTVLEAQWNNLPNYIDNECNVLVMADVSGSMTGRPMATSVGLALYFAERNKGPYHNIFMTFSGRPEIVEVKGSTLHDKIHFISKANWEMNTNLEAALFKILEIAHENNCSQDDLPKALIIISDMEIDDCTRQEHKEQFYDYVARKYEEVGYRIPNIVFWNVNSRHDVFHADKNRKGVLLVSGQSANTFRNVLNAIDKTPMDLMYQVLDSDRYKPITI